MSRLISRAEERRQFKRILTGLAKPSQDQEWERAVLSYNPFADDKDDGGWRLLSDRIVTARVAGECCECLQPIIPGTRIRVQTAVGEGKVASARTCNACCEAQAAWMMRGDTAPMEARLALSRPESEAPDA